MVTVLWSDGATTTHAEHVARKWIEGSGGAASETDVLSAGRAESAASPEMLPSSGRGTPGSGSSSQRDGYGMAPADEFRVGGQVWDEGQLGRIVSIGHGCVSSYSERRQAHLNDCLSTVLYHYLNRQ